MEASIAGRMSFATQKLYEIVKAAKDAPTLKDDQIKAGLPDVGKPSTQGSLFVVTSLTSDVQCSTVDSDCTVYYS